VIRAAGLALLVAAICVTSRAQEPPPLDARELASSHVAPERRAAIEAALRDKAYDQARTLLAEEVARDPRSPELLRLLGGVLFVTGDYLDCAIAFKKAEVLAPLDTRSRFTLAMAYVVLGRRDWARPELQALSASEPGSPLYPYWLARLDYEQERYVDAVAGFTRALAIDPAYMRAHDNLGLSYEALGRYDDAIRSYQEALRLERERHLGSPWPSLDLGILLARLDRLEEAEPLLRESAREDPRFAPARYQLGLVLEKRGRLPEAIAELGRAAELDPAYAEPHYALARLWRRRGEDEKADRALETCLALKKKKKDGSRDVTPIPPG